ncbi:hypothetical protein F7725_029094 [Dissostichus mawsoni]|uniref:Uncharacterized protein n=1 Tax=Dissostichus mawsoni TaxID=36200 RepID=A0A7J5XHG3_DISMA|nr:hypothetical protein F7725_029094 [Dissostichus mawsoni]
MTSPGPNPDLFRWRRLGESKTADKMHAKTDDIDQWRKRVEAASEFAVSEVFTHKKPHSGKKSRVESLQSSEQLRDHDDSYSEAQALLADWLNSKLRVELEVEEEEEEDDDLRCSDLYNCLAEEEEHSAVNSFLHDLMEQELLDSEVMEELVLDVGQTRKKLRNPIISMEARQLQVRENRERREAERLRQQREGEALREARGEARRRERGEEARRRQQEEKLQQEMVRLRRQREERRGLEQLEGHPRSKTLAPDDSSVHRNQTPVGVQAQPWQVTRRHAAPSASELHGSFSGSKSAAASGSRFENRHAVQQQIISQQRRLLKEQQEQISRLRDEQSMKGLELEMEKTAQLTQLVMTAESRPKSNHSEPTEQR